MIEGCKHGPANIVPQPCADCERDRMGEEMLIATLRERMAEQIPSGPVRPPTEPAK